MGYNKSIVIIDNSRQMLDYYDRILDISDYCIVGRAMDGKNSLSMIRKLLPSVVIMDIILPEMDGFELLDCLAADPSVTQKPAVLIVSAVGRDDMLKRAFSKGADYYMLKPLDKELFRRRLDSVFRQRKQISRQAEGMLMDPAVTTYVRSTEESVTNLLLATGVPPHIKGYQYLRDCIMIVSENKESINSVTKILYPAVARMNSTTTKSVERAVRHAIDITFRHEHTPVLDDLFGYVHASGKDKPTSAEFIAVLADRIRFHTRKDPSARTIRPDL